ncbi:hypothetical protein Tco_0533076 [Tanacetum coccineum]
MSKRVSWRFVRMMEYLNNISSMIVYANVGDCSQAVGLWVTIIKVSCCIVEVGMGVGRGVDVGHLFGRWAGNIKSSLRRRVDMVRLENRGEVCMRTRSSSNLVGNSSSNPTTLNPKHHNRRCSKQPFSLEESPVVTMADQCTMVELLRAPTEGYAEAIVVPPILAEHFELKHSLINMMISDQFFGLEKDNPHDHICWFNVGKYK